MNYIATIGPEDIPVRVEELGGARYKVTVGERHHVVDACRVRTGLWSVLRGSESFEVDIMSRDEECEVRIAADVFAFTLMGEQRSALLRAGNKSAAGKATVTSPMPGKVVKILVSEGEQVNAHQGIIVVEAMKMENELNAAVSGKVVRIFVKEGDVVESGTRLIFIAQDM